MFHLASLPETTRATVRSAHAAGRLVRVLPGTYVPTELKNDFATRSLAVGWWSTDAVIVGAAAARLTFWPDVPIRQIDVARRGPEPVGPGYRFHRRAIDPEHIVERHTLRVTAPALTAIDLVDEFGGDAIDICLRSRAVRLSDLWAAYAAHPARPGNAERRQMLLDSRDKPWSAAERLAHRLMRRHHLKGWTANLEIRVRGLEVLHRHRIPRGALGDRDRRPPSRGRPGGVRARPLPPERTRPRRLASAAIHVPHARRRARLRDRHDSGRARHGMRAPRDPRFDTGSGSCPPLTHIQGGWGTESRIRPMRATQLIG